MLFVDWGNVRAWLAAILMMIFAVWLVRKSLRANKRFKIIAWVTSVPTALLSLLLTLLLWMQRGCETAHQATYSPDHSFAARVLDWDAGATGGGTYVRIYSAHGLVTNQVYLGGWRSVDENGVRWIDNSSLEIKYQYPQEHSCQSTRQIRVICTSQ